MSLYMYICMYVDIHISICMYVYMDGYRQNYINVCMLVHTFTSMHTYRM